MKVKAKRFPTERNMRLKCSSVHVPSVGNLFKFPKMEIGVGETGCRKRAHERRVLRCRDENLSITIYVWNGQDKGLLIPYIRCFFRERLATPEEVKEQFKDCSNKRLRSGALWMSAIMENSTEFPVWFH